MDDSISRMYVTLADGTVRQWNPLTGDEAWVVPGRAHRPRPHLQVAAVEPLDVHEPEDYCDFCPTRTWRTTPEKARVIRSDGGIRIARCTPASALEGERPIFRRIGNLFEIVTFEFWNRNHGLRLTPAQESWRDAYLRDPEGEAHLRQIVGHKLRCFGRTAREIDALDRRELRELATPFFGGSHDLILADRHFRAGARTTEDLASSGTLTPDDHLEYVRFTLASARAIARDNPHVRHVAVFQNWLAAAGASFDHLHKQLLGTDRRGAVLERKIALEERNPNAFNRYGVAFALARGLLIAANPGAIAWADVGHPYPTVTIASRSAAPDPAELPEDDLRNFSDLLHAVHAAMGPSLACNEEWHTRPPGCRTPIPLHVHVKWRIHRSAGFEGMTRLHIVPLLPEEVRDRVAARLEALRDEGAVRSADPADPGSVAPDALAYRTGS